MKTVYKYPALLTPEPFSIRMPKDAHIVHVQPLVHYGVEAHVWAEVDTMAPSTRRFFQWVPTGEVVPWRSTYLGTTQTPGALILHLYEV
jgi:hypothetical protein